MLAWVLAASLLALAPPGPTPRGNHAEAAPRGNHAEAAPRGNHAEAAPRGNTVLTRRRGLVFGVAAVPRLALLLGDGARVIQPVGFGAELQLRLYALHLGPLRFGGQAHLGHTRVLERITVLDPTVSSEPIRRYAALGHTDFSLGPSLQIVAGPIILEGGAAVGLGISNLVRPLGPLPIDEVQTTDTTAMLRGGGQIAVPIRRNQGVVLGVHATKFFSNEQVVANPDPSMPDAVPDANPFDLVLEIGLGYQMWF